MATRMQAGWTRITRRTMEMKNMIKLEDAQERGRRRERERESRAKVEEGREGGGEKKRKNIGPLSR